MNSLPLTAKKPRFDTPDPAALMLALLSSLPALDVRIEDKPIGKARPRATRKGRMFTPKATEDWEKRAAADMALAWGRQAPVPCDEPVLVAIEAVVPRPQRLAKAGQGRQPCTAKPDTDNIVKIVLDSMVRMTATSSNVLADDKAVVGVLATKAYAAIGEEPHVRVRMYRFGGAT